MKQRDQFFRLFVLSVIAMAITAGCKKDNSTGSSPETKYVTNTALLGSKAFCSNCPSPSSTNNSSARMVVQNEIIYRTDFVSAGVGATRDIGNGVISLTGVSGTITKAYLYWHGVTNATTDVGNSIVVNGTTVNGTNIGVASPNCWPYNNSQGYRADVTALVQATGNGNYTLNGFGDLNPNGASLIVFFKDADNSNNRDVVLFEGNDSNIGFPGIAGNPNAPADDAGWDVLLPGINYTSGNANIQMHVADGQAFPDGSILINTVQLVPASGIFDGNSVPGVNNGPAGNGRLWDIRTFAVTSFLTPGENTLHMTSALGSDCLGLIVALIDLPAGAAPVTNIDVPFDFKPLGCPNPFNVTQNGMVPAAILGTADFDVSKIDISTIKLNGVAPASWILQDVAAPFTGTLSDCSSCTTAGPDGIPDLKMNFTNAALTASLGTVADMQCIEVQITGNLLPEFGGTSITGVDKIIVLKKK